MAQKSVLKKGGFGYKPISCRDGKLKLNPKMLPEYVTVYSALLDNTLYSKEAFELSERFFREMVGLDLRFKFCDSDEIPVDSLDHRTSLALVEIDKKGVQKLSEKLAERDVQSKFAHYYEDLKLLKKSIPVTSFGHMVSQDITPEVIMDIEAEINSLAMERRKFIAQEYKKTLGLADFQESTIYLFNIPATRRMFSDGSDSYNVHGNYSFTDCIGAEMVVHELGHLAGLWHTFQFSNDGFKNYVGKTPNVMSGVPASGREYGFTITRKQQEHLRDFFRGGEQFRSLQKHNFDFEAYLTEVAAANGYRFKRF